MGIRLFNTYSRQLEEFAPLDASSRGVKMYTCGPTVYNHAHIGNYRAYLFEDLLQRHLEARGYKVERVMNLTDVDDKTIRGARISPQSTKTHFSRTSTRCASSAPSISRRPPSRAISSA